MASAALTPELALDYLGELSADIEAAVVLDRANDLAASTEADPARAARLRELVVELLDRTAEIDDRMGADQVEVSTDRGSVFAVRGKHWSIAVATGRPALSSLMFYDLRHVIRELGEPG